MNLKHPLLAVALLTGFAAHAQLVVGVSWSNFQEERWKTDEAAIKAELDGFKVPKSVEFRSDPLPLSGALKILKRDLRAPFWEGKERSVS